MNFDNENINFAYVCGMYLTDGYLHNNKGYFGLRLRNVDLDIHEYYVDRLHDLTGNKPKIHIYKKGYKSTVYESEFFHPAIVDYLRSETQLKAIIPKFIYNMGLEWKKEFMAGLLDGDGWCSVSELRERTNRSTDNPDWHATIGITGLQQSFIKFMPYLLDNIGIRFSKYEVNKLDRQPLYSYRLDNKDFVDKELYFRCKRKQDKLQLIKDYRIGQRLNLKRRTETRSTNQENILDNV